MSAKAGIYALKHSITGRFYIGSSTHLDARRRNWKLVLRAKPSRRSPTIPKSMLPDLQEHGPDSFEFVVLKTYSEWTVTMLREQEQAFIERAVERTAHLVYNTVLPVYGEPINRQMPRRKHFRRLLTLNGETLAISQWAARAGVTPEALTYRLKQGWPLDRALTKGDSRSSQM